jgi:hypothetical protein
MTMKNAILATGAALVLAVLLSSPTFAQTSNQRPTNAAPAPAPVAAEMPADDTPLDVLIEQASTLEERARLPLRCVGPRPKPDAEIAQEPPASEPAVIATH